MNQIEEPWWLTHILSWNAMMIAMMDAATPSAAALARRTAEQIQSGDLAPDKLAKMYEMVCDTARAEADA